MRWLRLCLLTATLALSSAAAAQTVDVTEATEEQKTAAREAYKAGDKAFAAGKYEEALGHFRDSYDKVKSPNSHYMVARSLDMLGRHVEAYRELEATIAEADALAGSDERYAKTAATARDNLEQWRQKIGLLTLDVRAPAGASVSVGGRSIDGWDAPIPVEPGVVTVTLSTPDGTTERSVEVEAGGSAELTLNAPSPLVVDDTPPEEETDDGISGLRIGAYVGFGVGAVGLIGFGVFGGLHLNEYGKFEDECPDGSCAPDRSADADTGRTYQTIANVSLIVGIAGATAGLGLLIGDLVSDGSDDEGDDLAIAVGPGSLSLEGRF